MIILKRACCNHLLFILFFPLLDLLFSNYGYSEAEIKFSESPILQEKNIKDIAVLSGRLHGESENTYIEDGIFIVLLNYGYNVSSRSDVDNLLKEIKFQDSGLTDKGASQIGKMLNVKTVLISQGDRKFKEISLSLRLIDVETGEVLWVGTAREDGAKEKDWCKLAIDTASRIPCLEIKHERSRLCRNGVGIIKDKKRITQLDKVALLVNNVSESEIKAIEDASMQALMEKRYRVASRSDAEKVLKEISFQNSGITGSDSAKIGKMLNVKAVIIITAKNYGSRDLGIDAVGLSLRLIDLESNTLMWVSDQRDDCKGWISSSSEFAKLSSRAMSDFPER